MASENKTRASNSQEESNREVQLHPELMMAARDGSWELLSDLLNKEDAPAVPIVVVDVEAEETTANMDVDKAAHPTEEAATIGLDSILHVVAPAVPIVVVDVEAEETTANMDVDKAAHATKEAATIRLDSILHVVASSGDGEVFLKSADVIYGWAKHLLDARNKKGDTPLQCAVRAGNIEMVRHLIGLARREDGRDARVKVVLRNQNEQGETALHEALRLSDKKMVDEMVEVLVTEDSELARLVHCNGTSLLCLAVMLGHNDIAEKLYRKDKELSYSGPDGQNVLHVAVLRSKDMTKKLLRWNKDLTKQGDRSSGTTPLHIAASWGNNKVTRGSMYERLVCETAKLVLDADKSSAYQCDNHGSFPIHVAALGNNASVVDLLLKKCPDCAELRDARGSTFLHNAILKKKYCLVLHVSFFLRGNRLLVKDACQPQRFASIINMQDNEGNTGLHLAVKAGGLLTFYCLLWNKEVLLNLLNNKGQTALDLSCSKRPTGVRFGLDPQMVIFNLLNLAGAKPGIHRCDRFELPRLNKKEEAKKISDSTPTIGIASVLIVTVTFAAAFAIPGGYRADDHRNGGTPTLAKDPVFEAFVIANNLALLCSSLATISLMFAGVTTVDIRTRMNAFMISIFFLNSSARSLFAAFAFGLNAALAPVARTTAAVTWVMMALTLLGTVWYLGMIALGQLVLLNRLGVRACFLFARSIVYSSVCLLWPYVVIAGFFAYSKIHGVH